MRIYLSLLLVFLLWFSACMQLEAQSSQWTPENHRIQYQKFVWKYVSSSNFEVYYVDRNEVLAKTALTYLESDVNRVIELLSYSPYTKIKVFIYPNQEEWLQSNSGISIASSADAAAENLAKFRIEIAFKDNLAEFKKDLTKQVARIYLHDLLFGGSVKDVLQNSLLLNVSDWFVLGMAAYLAEGDSPDMHRFTYQIISENKIRKLQLVKGKEAEYLGQSIWAYVAATYGNQAIGNIVNLTRIIRSEQSSISSTIRKPFSKFLKDWYDYYLNEAKQLEVNSQKIFPLSDLAAPGVVFNSLRVSPDGTREVWVSNESGRFRVHLHTLATNKTQIIFQTGLKDLNRSSEGRGPLLSWSDPNHLSVLYSEQGFAWYRSFQIATSGTYKAEEKRKLANLSYLGMSASPNGTKLLVRVLEKGQVDVGIFDLKRNRLNLITKDTYDESEALWLANNQVLYVSDRYIDSLPAPRSVVSSVFIYHPEDSENPTRLFSTSGKIQNVQFRSDSVAYFLQSQSNGNRLIRMNLPDTTFQQLDVRSIAWENMELSTKGISSLERDILTDKIVYYPWSSVDEIPSSAWIPGIFETAAPVVEDLAATNSISSDAARKTRKARLERQQSLRLKKEPGKFVGPMNYENSFVINSSEGQFKSDPLRGIGYSYEIKANDLLENHLFKAGAFVTANLRNADLWGEYAYLANKLDWKFRYDRKVYSQDIDADAQKIRYNRFALTATYPFSLLSRLSITGMYSSNRLFSTYNLAAPEDYAGYAGTSVQYLLDKTVQAGANLRTGLRLDVVAEAHKDVQNAGDYVRFGLDARYYYKISNTFYVASRFSASHQLGLRAPAAMLGGMENWLFNKNETRTQESPLGLNGLANRDVFMSNFVAPLRGFSLNKLSGNSHLLLNVEIRMPVKSLMAIESSSLLNSLQLVGFTDVGTAWSGSSPFEKSNGFNTNVYGGKTNPFQATVTDYRNPFLVGYGFGARAAVFGYFVKFDYAFGLENKEVKPPVAYLTLGYDF